MKITNIDIYCSCADLALNLSFRDPSSQNSYIVKSIEGLDAAEISSKFYGVGLSSDSKYYSMSMPKRDINFRIVLNPKFALQETVESLRDQIYKVISSSRSSMLEVRFKNGTAPIASIKGLVTKLESVYFSDKPEIVLSLHCPDPMLNSMTEIFNDLEFDNPNLPVIVDDESTAPHGFYFGVEFDGPSPSFKIQDSTTPDWVFEVMPGDIFGILGFQNQDVLHFSSVNKDRFLYLQREGQTIHLLDKVKTDAIWPILFPGENSFVITANNFDWSYISYKHSYWGI